MYFSGWKKRDSYVKIFKPEIAYRIQQTALSTLHTKTKHISRSEDIMNILLIEDDPEISSMPETFLTTENYIITAAMVSISFLALPVGLHLKSSKAAIIAGLIIIFGTQGNLGSYTLMYNLPFYGVLLVLAFAAIVLSVYPVEKKDVA